MKTHKIIETQIDHLGNTEHSYRLEYFDEALQKQITDISSSALVVRKVELVSHHKKDNLVNFSDTVTISYEGEPTYNLLRHFGVLENINFMDYFVLKFDLEQKDYYLKVYDSDFFKYKIPQLPKLSRIGSQFGIGKYFGRPKLSKHRDVYFFHHDTQEVYQHFKLGEPINEIYDSTDGLALFGVSYLETEKGTEIIKLKRYFYPDDMNIHFPEKI